MATINYTTEVNLADGCVKVEWPGLSAGDDGQAFECGGLRLGSIQYWGNFGGGVMSIRASNEISPTNFSEFTSSGSAGVHARVDGVGFGAIGAIKPVAGSGNSGVGVALIFVKA